MRWFRRKPHVNSPDLIRLPLEDSKENYLQGFWRWVGLMEQDDFAGAIDALFWSSKPCWTAKSLKKRITSFWGGKKPWSVAIPNARLIKVIEDQAEYYGPDDSGQGWLLVQIPVTTEPQRSKDDDIPLQGVAASFTVRQHEGSKVLEFELFHL